VGRRRLGGRESLQCLNTGGRSRENEVTRTAGEKRQGIKKKKKEGSRQGRVGEYGITSTADTGREGHFITANVNGRIVTSTRRREKCISETTKEGEGGKEDPMD